MITPCDHLPGGADLFLGLDLAFRSAEDKEGIRNPHTLIKAHVLCYKTPCCLPRLAVPIDVRRYEMEIDLVCKLEMAKRGCNLGG
jgi:hypothetical protein